MTEELQFECIDERLLGHIINRPCGAREVFRKLQDPGPLERKTYQWIFTACKRTFDKQKPAPYTLSKDMVVAELQAMGVYDDVDKTSLSRIMDAKINANELAATLKTILERHKTTEINKAIAELSMADSEKRLEVVDRIADLQRSATSDPTEQMLTLDDWMAEVDVIEQMPDCVPTGMPLLDAQLGGGWSKGGFHVISAPPGTGKTILMLTAWKYQLDQGIPSLYINYEISRSMFMKFMFAQFTGVNVQTPGWYSSDEIAVAKEDFKKTVADLYDRNLLLITDPMAGSSKYWNDVEGMLTQFSEDYGSQTVFFDTVNSVSATTKRGQDARWNEYEVVARGAEGLCQSLDLALVLSAQQDTESIKRDDKTPKLGDVAGSKTLTEKAASVIHLFRSDLHRKMEGVTYSELYVTKNRSTGILTTVSVPPIRINYDNRYKRYYELSDGDQGSQRGTMVSPDGPFPSPSEVTGVRKHPTLQIDIEDGKEL